MTDKYDDAIQILTDDPTLIREAWMNFDSHSAGCLFKLLPGRFVCLTSAKNNDLRFPKSDDDDPLLKRIIKDDRIPCDVLSITVDMLPAFAEYQREFDKMGEGDG